MQSMITDPAALGQLVNRLRKQQKLTQAEVALAAGVGLRFLVELEAGKPSVRLENVMRVLAVLGIALLADHAELPASRAGA